MKSALIVLCALLLASVALGMKIPHQRLSKRQSSSAEVDKTIGISDSENGGGELSTGSGRVYGYGREVTADIETSVHEGSTKTGNTEEDLAQEPLLKNTKYVYSYNIKRPISSAESSRSDEKLSVESSAVKQDMRGIAMTQDAIRKVPGSMKESAFDDSSDRFKARVPSSGFSWEKRMISFEKPRLADDVKNTVVDDSSENNVGGPREVHEMMREHTNYTEKDANEGGDYIPTVNSPEQDGGNDWRKQPRLRRTVISVPYMRTLPNELDLGSSRCRNRHRLGRGRYLCRSVW